MCDNKYLVSLATTIYFAGVMIGGGVFGQLGDVIGRKPVLLVCLYGHVVLGVGVHFANSYGLFVVLRFFVGFLIQVKIDLRGGTISKTYLLIYKRISSPPMCEFQVAIKRFKYTSEYFHSRCNVSSIMKKLS